MPIIDKLLTPKDIQQILGISKTNTYRLIRQKGFPQITIGRKYFVQESKLNQYLNEQNKAKVNIKY